jgi:hypothetical protein
LSNGTPAAFEAARAGDGLVIDPDFAGVVADMDRAVYRIHHALYVECREKAEREASPTACIIDSQSVKSAEKGGPALILTGSMRAN